MKILVVDPPSGWQYGFPKETPDNFSSLSEEEKTKWFLEQGYPSKLIAAGMLKHLRYWYWEKENSTA